MRLRREVQHAVHIILVVAKGGWVAFIHFAGYVYTGCLFEGRIESFIDRFGAVNTETIN